MEKIDESDKYINEGNSLLSLASTEIHLKILGYKEIQEDLNERKKSFYFANENKLKSTDLVPTTPLLTLSRKMGRAFFLENIKLIHSKMNDQLLKSLTDDKKCIFVTSKTLQVEFLKAWKLLVSCQLIIKYDKENKKYFYVSDIKEIDNLTGTVVDSLYNLKINESVGKHIDVVKTKNSRIISYDISKLIIALYNNEITIDYIENEWRTFVESSNKYNEFKKYKEIIKKENSVINTDESNKININNVECVEDEGNEEENFNRAIDFYKSVVETLPEKTKNYVNSAFNIVLKAQNNLLHKDLKSLYLNRSEKVSKITSSAQES